MTDPSTELELRVLEALEVPRSVGDLLFLRPALKEAGREAVEVAMKSLSSSGMVSQVEGGKLWSLTEDGARWLRARADWWLGVPAVVPVDEFDRDDECDGESELCLAVFWVPVGVAS